MGEGDQDFGRARRMSEPGGRQMPNEEIETHHEVLWPLARKAAREDTGAPRVPDLSGKTIAELWDAKFHGETIFPLLREGLRARYPGVKFIEYSEFGNFYGPRESEIIRGLPAKLRRLKCDVVIAGIGA